MCALGAPRLRVGDPPPRRETHTHTTTTPHSLHPNHSLARGPAACKIGVNFKAMAIDPPILSLRVMNSCWGDAFPATSLAKSASATVRVTAALAGGSPLVTWEVCGGGRRVGFGSSEKHSLPHPHHPLSHLLGLAGAQVQRPLGAVDVEDDDVLSGWWWWWWVAQEGTLWRRRPRFPMVAFRRALAPRSPPIRPARHAGWPASCRQRGDTVAGRLESHKPASKNGRRDAGPRKTCRGRVQAPWSVLFPPLSPHPACRLVALYGL